MVGSAGTPLRIAVVTDEEYVTLGVPFRTPCPPDMVAAIGRVIYNFVSLEGQVASLLVDAHEVDAHEARTLMAGKRKGTYVAPPSDTTGKETPSASRLPDRRRRRARLVRLALVAVPLYECLGFIKPSTPCRCERASFSWS